MSEAEMHRRVYQDVKDILKMYLNTPDDISEYMLVREIALLAAQHDAALRLLDEYDPESAALFRGWREITADPSDETLDSMIAATDRPPDGYTQEPT